MSGRIYRHSRRPLAGAVGLALVCLAAGSPALSAVLRVDPPPGHSVQDAGTMRGFSEAYAVASTLDQDAGCIAGFQNLPSDLSQEKLNAEVDTPLFVQSVSLYLKLISKTVSTEKVEQQGVRGLAVRGDTTDSEKETALATIFRTPKGSVVVSCLGPTAHFDRLRPEFESIVHGVVLPK